MVSALFEKKPEKIWAADLHLDAGRQVLYASERGTSTIAGFKVDPGEGTPTPIGHTATEQQPRGFAIDASGRYLLAVGQLSDSMTSYAIDPASGKPAKLQAISDGQKSQLGGDRQSALRRLDFGQEVSHDPHARYRTDRRHPSAPSSEVQASRKSTMKLSARCTTPGSHYALLDLPRPAPAARPADRLRQALRAARVRDDGDHATSAPTARLRVEKDNDDVMKILKGNMGWHHDSTYMPVQAKGAVFSAEEVPTIGGRTGFADMRAAYDALDRGDARPGSKASTPTISLHYSQGRRSATRPRRLTASTRLRPARRAGAAAAAGQDPSRDRPQVAAGRPPRPQHPGPAARRSPTAGLRELIDFARQPPRIYHHDWTPGDAVVWDNRRLLHQATPWT